MLNNLKDLNLNHSEIKLNNKTISLDKLKTKEIYLHCLYPLKRPSCIEAWESCLNLIINWDKVCKIVNHSFQARKQKQFHWKSVHRCIYTEDRLKQMGKSNGICKICNENVETICHLLCDCIVVKPVWSKMESIIKNVTGINIVLDNESKIFGVCVDELREINYIINLIIYETKWQIWKNRNCVRYGKNISLESSNIVRNIEIGYKITAQHFKLTKYCTNLYKKLEKILNML